MAHREDIRAYLEGLEIDGTAIDWGSGAKPASKYVKGDAVFYSLDNNPASKPDKVHDITLPIKVVKADHAFCMEVLEHVTYPERVLENIYFNLKEGGMLHLSVPFLFPIHGEQDYWRFTDQGLELLAERAGFKQIKVWEIEQGYLMEAKK